MTNRHELRKQRMTNLFDSERTRGLLIEIAKERSGDKKTLDVVDFTENCLFEIGECIELDIIEPWVGLQAAVVVGASLGDVFSETTELVLVIP